MVTGAQTRSSKSVNSWTIILHVSKDAAWTSSSGRSERCERLTSIVSRSPHSHPPWEDGSEIEQLVSIIEVALASICHVGDEHGIVEARAGVVRNNVHVVLVAEWICRAGSEVVFLLVDLAGGEGGGDGDAW